MKRIMIAGVALAAMAPMAWAAEVTAKQAELAAKNWINRDPHRLNASFRSANAEDVATAYGASGRVLYHVVQLDGGGFVVTAGDTRLTPVVAFSDEGCYVAGRESALRSGIIYDGQNSYLQTKVTGAGTLTFWWKVSSESGNDALRFLVDGVQKQVISGEKDWAKVTLSITGSGEHRLKWNYVKNGSVTKGEDFGWLDQITWTGK